VNEALAQELVAMFERDQENCDADPMDEMMRVTHAERLKDIIAEHGWPTIPLVGEQGSLGAWILAQHADHDHAFQLQCLDLMAAEVAKGTISRWQFAYLVDRVLANHKQAQIFGTQLQQPAILDIAHVNARRALAGMKPYEDYVTTQSRL
jgi:uncharacterized protein DUF6624